MSRSARTPWILVVAFSTLAACGEENMGPSMGSLEVAVIRSGFDPDETLSVSLDDGSPQTVGPDGVVTFPGVDGGEHAVALLNVAPNCLVAGENPRTVTVADGDVSTATFEVSCTLARRLAFWTTRDGQPEVYVMNADGTGATNLSNHPAIDVSPSWSPDGTRIAFESDRDGDREIYVVNADGTGLANLTNAEGGDTYAAWSPDGARIAYSRRPPNESSGIFVMNADGSDPTRLTTNPGETDFDPAWSPDGSRVAFVRRQPDGEIYVMNADGTGLRNLTEHAAHDLWPEWSPDGSSIVFSSDRDGNRDIFRMRSDGTETVNLTSSSVFEITPEWAPASSILFTIGAELYVMQPDGSEVTQLSNDQLGYRSPTWAPVF